jgi:hypothetical protein
MLNPHVNRQTVGRLYIATTVFGCFVATLIVASLTVRAVTARPPTVTEVLWETPAPVPVQGPQVTVPSVGTVPAMTSVEGIVLDGTTNMPIAGVTLRTTTVSGSRISAASDSQGRFALSGLEAGAYRLVTNKEGYVPAQPEGRRQPTPSNRLGVLVSVAAGEPVKGIVIRLDPESIVTGRVVDSKAEPLEGVSVSLVRKAYGDDGRLRDYYFEDAETNDRGEYRIFSVAAGEYYVKVDGEWTSETSVYYPGDPDFDRALPVVVRKGAEVRLNDVVLQQPESEAQRVRVTVRLINETGAAPGEVWSAHWGLKGKSGVGMTSSANAFGGPGMWNIRGGLLPGQNDISLAWNTPAGWAFGQKTIQVGKEDLTVDLPIRKGVKLTTRAVLEAADGSPRPLGGLGLSFMGHPRSVNFNPASTPRTVTGDDGILLMTDVPEIPFDVTFSRLPPDAYLIRAREGAHDLLREPAEVRGDSTIEVVVGSGGGTIEGSVTNAAGKRIAGAEVILVPESALRDSLYLYKTAQTDQQGRYLLRGIAPGTYKVFGLSEFNGFAPYLNAEFMKRIEDKGIEVKVARAQKLTAAVRLADEEQ